MQACIKFCMMAPGFIAEEMWSRLNFVYENVDAVVLSHRERGNDLRFGQTSFEIISEWTKPQETTFEYVNGAEREDVLL